MRISRGTYYSGAGLQLTFSLKFYSTLALSLTLVPRSCSANLPEQGALGIPEHLAWLGLSAWLGLFIEFTCKLK